MSQSESPLADSPLAAFLPPIRDWFQATLGAPTPPQQQGWPAIQRGENVLITAPTGSGKTLTAFLWGLDEIYRELLPRQDAAAAPVAAGAVEPASARPKRRRAPAQPDDPPLRLVYISPLKALNNDIERNLRTPLAGIQRTAAEQGRAWPGIDVAVRSGDTPTRERQAMLRKPPHILITTPESLYILLTSPKARELFRGVRTVIVDEIHTLAGSKRGVHLSLSLERLQHLAAHPIQRIGLSATIQPLAEVARYLGGNTWTGIGEGRTLTPRPVTIVDAAYHKQLDLLVETVVEDFRNLPGESVWPTIIPRVVDLIDSHRSTLIFVNNRRLAERAADWINEYRAARATMPNNPAAGLLVDGLARGRGMFAAGSGNYADPIRAHHGSMSKEVRLALETDLKAGRLPAIIGTSSLELGIDIGAVDLVVQLQAPKAVAQGLQRIGRAGHLVGQTSAGRIFPTHREDVMEAAAVAGGMLRKEVEPTHTPRNALDVLAQQIVAMVALENWNADALYDLIRCAYAYEEITLRVYHAVVEMLAGRYPSLAHGELRARIVWDRVNNELAALPGSRLLAMTSGGTISDRGAFGAYLSDGKTKLGELDEEFVYETRPGDVFTLGSQVWRVLEISDDKVIVGDAAGATPRMPFWRGDFPWRAYELGRRVGAFRRAVAERVQDTAALLGVADCSALAHQREHPAVQELLAWLRRDYALDDNSAWIAVDYVAGQLDHAGAISSDRTILVEVFDDALGDPRLVVHSPFGGRVNGLWALALTSALGERTGVEVEVQSNDDGILFRFPAADADFPLDVVTQLTAAEARERILAELPNSAVFGAQFRQNAARALLLPGLGRGKRTPFWLQRLRARDLLQVVRKFQDFPIVAETYRDCLQEVMDLPHLEQVLTGIERGEIEVVAFESLNPTPVAQSLLWDLVAIYMYEWDAPKAERQLQTLAANRDLLQDLLTGIDLSHLLRPEAVAEVRSRLQRTAPAAQVRTLEELAHLFQTVGDLSSVEVAERCAGDPIGWIGRLAGANRVVALDLPTARGPQPRWVAAEVAHEYAAAFGLALPRSASLPASGPDEPPGDDTPDAARRHILARYLAQAGPITYDAILQRYAFPPAWLTAELDRLVAERSLAQGQFTPAAGHALDQPGTPFEGRVSNPPSPTAAPMPALPGDPGSVITQPVTGTPAAAPQYLDRRTLEQIHRRTLSILRAEVQPVPLPAYVNFLAQWQHLDPAHRLAGPDPVHATRQVIQQLRAFPVIGRLWERDVLPARVAGYHPGTLAALSQSGELVWAGAGGIDPRRWRIRFFFRGEGDAYLEPAPQDEAALAALSPHAQATYALLKSEGAIFEADLRTGLDLSAEDAAAALWELAMAGLATNDSFAAVQQRIEGGAPRPPAERKPFSSLESDLAERLGQRRLPPGQALRRPSQSAYAAAKKRVGERLGHPESVPAAPVTPGRWTLVHRLTVLGKPLTPSERAERQARQLLARWGVVTHDSLEGEIGSWEWATLYPEFQRLELRGEVRRGYFVQGLPGVQFALPDAVERLRAANQPALGQATGDTDDPVLLLNACDPANLYGPDLGLHTATGEPFTFARIPSNWLALQRGYPLLLIAGDGTDLTVAEHAHPGQLQRALAAWLAHVAPFESRITVNTWNAAPVLGSPGQPLLEAAGFARDYMGMTWHRPV